MEHTVSSLICAYVFSIEEYGIVLGIVSMLVIIMFMFSIDVIHLYKYRKECDVFGMRNDHVLFWARLWKKSSGWQKQEKWIWTGFMWLIDIVKQDWKQDKVIESKGSNSKNIPSI